MPTLPARCALVLLAIAAVARAQIPSLGWCPDYVPMAEFNMDRYLGTWYEAERYFSVLEAGSRCVSTNYTKAVDGRVLVSNQITNRLTGIKRVVEGEIRNVVKGSESKLNIKYSTLPVPFETTYSVLDTDYDSYAVVWSCSSIGPLRTQSAWVMTRERLAPGTVLQMAYNILDKYKISRTFFVKTDQADCAIAEAAAEAEQRKQQQLQQQQHDIHEKSAGVIVDPVVKPVVPVVPVAPVAPVVTPIAPVVVPAVKSDVPIVPGPVVPVAPVIPVAPVVPVAPVAPAVVEQVKSVQPQVPLPIAAAAAAAANAPVVPVAPVAPAIQAAPVEIPTAPVVHVAPVVPAAPVVQQPVSPSAEVNKVQ